MRKSASALRVSALIHTVRGQKVILDEDLATLYGVQTRALVQAVKRNRDRFPVDFLFQLDKGEHANLRSQSVTSRWGGRRVAPWAFTEQGVAMLSGVLRSPKAIEVNIAIMRAFVQMRGLVTSTMELTQRLNDLETKVGSNEANIQDIFQAIREMMTIESRPRPRIGFRVDDEARTKDRS